VYIYIHAALFLHGALKTISTVIWFLWKSPVLIGYPVYSVSGAEIKWLPELAVMSLAGFHILTFKVLANISNVIEQSPSW